MKKLLFLLCLALSTTLFYSCGGDDDNSDAPQTETEIVQNAVKGKFYKTGIGAYQFTNNTEVDVWTDIVEDGKYYHYHKGTFQIYPEKQYIVIKTSLGEILLYYKVENGKVYLYTDADKIANIPNTNKPTDLTEESKEKPIDPTNPDDIKAILQNGTWISESSDFLKGSSFQDRQANPFYLKFVTGDMLSYGKNAVSPIVSFGMKYNEKGFYLIERSNITLQYQINSVTTTEVHLTYLYRTDAGYKTYMGVDIVLRKYVKPN